MLENVTNHVLNHDLILVQLLNKASMFYSTFFYQHVFIMFENIKYLNYIIFGKTKLALKKTSYDYIMF